MDERAVLAQAKAGDPAAFGSLVRAYQARVRAFLVRLTGGDRALADDLAQETFITAYRKIRQFRGEGTLAGWLYRIAYTELLMDVRARKPPPEEAADPSGAGEHDGLARLDLERAMARLAHGERAALTLCYGLGFSNEEAASILKMPLGTVKSHILRGREKLKELLGPWSGGDSS